jgi:hypothetical protein
VNFRSIVTRPCAAHEQKPARRQDVNNFNFFPDEFFSGDAADFEIGWRAFRIRREEPLFMGASPRAMPRRSERRPVEMIAHLFAISDDEMLGAGARTLDLSATGSRLRTVLDVMPGELIEFHPFGLGNAVLARVVWKEHAGEQNEIGVEFLQNLPPSSEA